jgi:hypothetical protein
LKADLEWTEKLDGGIKQKVRITFVGRSGIKWQFLRSDAERWDYDSPPTPENWETLEQNHEALYTRRRLPLKRLELARKLRKEALS